MYVYKHLVSAVGIPQTWNQLGSHHHLSLQQPWGCSCWLLNHALDLSPTVCLRYLGENWHSSVCPSFPISLLECLWHFRRKLVPARRDLVVSLGVQGSHCENCSNWNWVNFGLNHRFSQKTTELGWKFQSVWATENVHPPERRHKLTSFSVNFGEWISVGVFFTVSSIPTTT